MEAYVLVSVNELLFNAPNKVSNKHYLTAVRGGLLKDFAGRRGKHESGTAFRFKRRVSMKKHPQLNFVNICENSIIIVLQ